jgi:alpha-L-fucosidase
VGPRPDGQIEPEHAGRLREVGDWLKRYGESIYATRGGPYLPGDFGVSTYRDRTIYLHILKPTGKALLLPALPARMLGCSSLTGGSATCKQGSDSVEITLNGNADAVDTIVALTLASPAAEIAPIATPVGGNGVR